MRQCLRMSCSSGSMSSRVFSKPAIVANCWKEAFGIERGGIVQQGYRLLLVDRDGVLISEFQLTENDLADPQAFVAALKHAIEEIEEAEP